MVIREFEKRDLEAARSLLEYVMKVEAVKNPKENVEEMLKERFLSPSTASKNIVLVADASDRAVGLLLLECAPLKTARITYIVVDPEFQNKGVGKALIEKAAIAAREQGASGLEVLIHKDNVRSREFHQHIGFLPFGYVLRKAL
jgi:GNAT superfamily N-acetyltransferase